MISCDGAIGPSDNACPRSYHLARSKSNAAEEKRNQHGQGPVHSNIAVLMGTVSYVILQVLLFARRYIPT
jgi:uncharacterized membrane protein